MKRNQIKWGILFLFALASIPACQSIDNSEKEITQISIGSSFGMCEGYCHNETIYKTDTIINISIAWGDTLNNPRKVTKEPVINNNWVKIINSINLDVFYNLPATLGCPDCADGGASWVRIDTKDGHHIVNYEYGNPPSELEELLNTIKKMN